jgi:hypothetical protein
MLSGQGYPEEATMRTRRFSTVVALALTWLALQGVGSVGAGAKEAVDVALVLAADVSRSITTDEFQLQRQGYASGITNPAVVKAIRAGTHGVIAMTYVEWSGASEQQIVVDWQIIRDDASAKSFADTLSAAPRSFYGRTAISSAIDFAMARLKESGVKADRQIIDVSGDGTSNAGRPLPDARGDAVAAGVTVNGLAIINDNGELYGGFSGHTHPPGGLPNWYRDNVIGGPGAFLLVVNDFEAFSEAMTNKLLNEIAGLRPIGALALGIPLRSAP